MSVFTLTLSCPQRLGIVHAVTRFLYEHNADIVEHQQFDDAVRDKLFLRTAFRVDDGCRMEDIQADFAPIADEFQMSFSIRDERLPKVLVMVSKQGHCLNDLIFRWRSSTLGGDLAVVVSNHEDLRPMADGRSRWPGSAQRALHRRLPLSVTSRYATTFVVRAAPSRTLRRPTAPLW